LALRQEEAMPGLIITSNFETSKINSALSCLNFGGNYSQDILCNIEQLQLHVNHYKGYPIAKILNLDLTFHIEGFIYNHQISEVIASLTFLIRNKQFDEILELVKSFDGEFLIAIEDKKNNQFYLINDSWGRLPIYIYTSKNSFTISREIKFITSLINDLSYNPLAIATNLLFGYSLGENTLWNEVVKLKPNSIITVNTKDNSFVSTSNFKIGFNGSSSINNTSNDILAELKSALHSRISKLKNPSLSLSGGLDSRLLAGCLKDLSLEIPLITYSFQDQQSDLDLTSSQNIAKKLNFDKLHEIYQLNKTKSNNISELLNIKQGLNYLGMGFILPYYQFLKGENYSTITGDGGDKFFVDLSPLKNIRNQQGIIKYLLTYNATISLQQASDIACISKAELTKHIVGELNSYGTDDFNQQYKAFIIKNRGINWLFEGEDRNRYYSWSTSPYYSPKLIEKCLNYSDKKKQKGQLFLNLMKKLPGELDTILNPDWNVSLSNQKGIEKLFLRQKLKGLLPKSLRPSTNTMLLEEFEFSSLLATETHKNQRILILKQIEDKKYSSTFYWRLLTLLLLVNSKDQ